MVAEGSSVQAALASVFGASNAGAQLEEPAHEADISTNPTPVQAIPLRRQEVYYQVQQANHELEMLLLSMQPP